MLVLIYSAHCDKARTLDGLFLEDAIETDYTPPAALLRHVISIPIASAI